MVVIKHNELKTPPQPATDNNNNNNNNNDVDNDNTLCQHYRATVPWNSRILGMVDSSTSLWGTCHGASDVKDPSTSDVLQNWTLMADLNVALQCLRFKINFTIRDRYMLGQRHESLQKVEQWHQWHWSTNLRIKRLTWKTAWHPSLATRQKFKPHALLTFHESSWLVNDGILILAYEIIPI